MPKLSLSLLGTPHLEKDGHPVVVDTRKAIAMLAYLALTEQIQARDTLATLFWPEYDQTRARASLRRTLSALNKALDKYGLDIQRETIGIDPEADFWVDVKQFQQLLQEVEKHGHNIEVVCPRCLSRLERAVELYQGDFMSGFSLRDSPEFDDWQFFQGDELRREFSNALEKLVTMYSLQGDYKTAIEYARRWLALDPLLESAHRQLISLYAWFGQRNAALRQYRACVRTLEEELGVPPLEETTLLYQAVLENDLPPKPTPSGPVDSQAKTLLEEKAATSRPSGPIDKRAQVYPLVGRQAQWQVLIDAYSKSQKKGYFLILKGETGIGKTRLAQEFLDHVQTQGGYTITGVCHEGETPLAYGPFLTGLRAALDTGDRAAGLNKIDTYWLSEAARLLPEFNTLFPSLPPIPSLEGPGAQGRFFEGMRQTVLALLSGPSAGVLFLDDLHWADTASLDLLAYLARRLNDFNALILGTWNTDIAPQNYYLDRLVAELQRDGKAAQLVLPRLEATHVSDLVTTLGNTAITGDDQLDQRLFEESEGLPFLVVEYLKATLQGSQPAQTTHWDLPTTVREALRSRITGVDETARQLLSTAAVIGRTFDFNTLQEASGRSEVETVRGLESLLSHALIVERKGTSGGGSINYDFTHEKLRQVTLEETSLTRRRLLHHRVAEALVSPARHQPEPESIASLVAYHYERGGDELQAAKYYKMAGENARKLHANRDALAHFQSALALGYPGAAALHEAIGDILTLLGEYQAAMASYQKSAALCEPDDLARVEHKLGNLYLRLGDWELAECHYQAAMEWTTADQDPALLSILYADLSRTAHRGDQPARAMEMARFALELAERTQDKAALAQAHNVLGIITRRGGQAAQAIGHLTESLQLAETLPDPGVRVAALNNLALAYAEDDQLDQAIKLTLEALQACIRLGDRHREAALHNNLADLYHAAGRQEDSMAQLKEAVVIFAEIGVEAGSMKSEIWKLTEW